MKTVLWNESEQWVNHHHYELLIEDITGFSLKESLCTESVKYIAKRLKDTPYRRAFFSKYSIYRDEYETLKDNFNNVAQNNGKIVIK